ncbi:methyl-accepting chemotaxis protein [Treponema sp.]|uniref:methyl-accepting chemotaxis protein n=1 Tax=Treponema sp. TaxID=166 RepID=UPI00388D150B
MNFIKRQIKKFKTLPLDFQITSMMFALSWFANTVILGYCSIFAKFSMDYTPIQLAWIIFSSLVIALFSEIMFHFIVTKPMANNLLYWEATKLSSRERTNLLEITGSYPVKKAYQLAFLFIITGAMYSGCAHYLMNADLHISIFYFHLYTSLAYMYILITIHVLEKKCSPFAVKIASQGIELKEKKFFGLSQRANFILYMVIPIIGTSLITIHTVFYAFHAQTIHSTTGTMTSRNLSYMESFGLYIKTNFTKPETMLFILKISIVNTIATCILIYFYYTRILNSTTLMQNSLVMLNNNKVDRSALFEVNIFSEDSYTMHLINRTILLFDSIIRNNTKTNKDIDNISRMLSQISSQTTENVIRQSANIEEILATMQSVDNLSKKIESNFDEVITVASKTMISVDTTFVDLNDNFDKIKEITDTNRITIENLKKLSDKISGIQEVINSIDKFAEQTKTVAFNAELEANNIKSEGTNFTNVAEEIRHLSNNTLELTKKIHAQITDITNASEDLIATGNYCMRKTKEGNEICIQLGEKFEEIKQSARSTSFSSSNIKESLHEQTNSFHQLVETLSQIAKSVRNFGSSSTTIADTIENLRQNSMHILALNNKYNKSDDIEEGNAL